VLGFERRIAGVREVERLRVIKPWPFREGLPLAGIARPTVLMRNAARRTLVNSDAEPVDSKCKTPCKTDDDVRVLELC